MFWTEVCNSVSDTRSIQDLGKINFQSLEVERREERKGGKEGRKEQGHQTQSLLENIIFNSSW